MRMSSARRPGAQRGLAPAALGARADAHRREDHERDGDHASRSSRAARSGATGFRSMPVPSSSPACCGEARADVDPPAVVLGAARRGAHPEVQRGRAAEAPRQARERVVQRGGAERPLVLEAHRRAPRGDQQLVGRGGRVRREDDGLVVDRDDALAEADLLLHEVGEQVAAHRASSRTRRSARARGRSRTGTKSSATSCACVCGCEAPAGAPVVDEQVHAGGAVRGVVGHAPAPHRHRELELGGVQLGERADRRAASRRSPRGGRARPRRRRGPRAPRAAGRVASGLSAGKRFGHDAHRPAGRVGRGLVRAQRVELRRRAVLVALEERVALGVDRRVGGRRLQARSPGARRARRRRSSCAR